jgi:hypothetical protein
LKGGFHLRRTNQLANELGVSEAIIESRGMGLVHVQPLAKGRASTRVIFSDTPVLRATGWSSPPRRLSPKAAARICWQCDFRRKTLNFATECVRAQGRFYFSWRKSPICILPSASPVRDLLRKTNAERNREKRMAIKWLQQKKPAVPILTRLGFMALSKSHSLCFDSLGYHFGRRESGYIILTQR